MSYYSNVENNIKTSCGRQTLSLANPTVSDCDPWLRINMISLLLEQQWQGQRGGGTVPMRAPIPLLIPVKPEERITDQSQTPSASPPTNGEVVER